MYDRKGSQPMSESECKPDYEKQAKEQAEEMGIVQNFMDALEDFITVVKPYRRDDGLALLYGTVAIDIIEREKNLERILTLVEKHK